MDNYQKENRLCDKYLKILTQDDFMKEFKPTPFEEFVYDPNKKVNFGEKLVKTEQAWKRMMKAVQERDYDTANQIAEDNHLLCRFKPKSDNRDKDFPSLDKILKPDTELYQYSEAELKEMDRLQMGYIGRYAPINPSPYPNCYTCTLDFEI